MDIVSLAICVAAAFFAGLIDSVAGGGGLISLPALLAVGVPAHVALGTNKFQSMFGTSCALVNFGRKAKVIWKIAAWGIPFSLLGSFCGAKMALVVPEAALARVIVALLPPAAVLLFVSRALVKKGDGAPSYNVHFWSVTLAICLAVGAYDGFFGPGTGTFFIIALVLVSHLPLVKASATAKTFNLASNAGALAAFVVAGSVNYRYAVMMAVANMAGNLLGSHHAIKRGNEFVQKIVFVSLAMLFVYLIWKYY